jgi:hypothetical protein
MSTEKSIHRKTSTDLRHLAAVGLALLLASGHLFAEESQPTQIKSSDAAPSIKANVSEQNPRDVFPADEWRRIDSAVDQGLAFLASQQQPDGSFPTMPYAQPGVTSLCVMAFMAHGHTPGNGPYGNCLNRAVAFICDCQKPSGLMVHVGGNEPRVNRNIVHELGVAGTYDHAIASLTLSELYGMNPANAKSKLPQVIEKALAVTLEMQNWPKKNREDKGGWRYVDEYKQEDSDLSVTGWHLMFLRSARNAGFNVPDAAVNDAVAYIRRTYNSRYGNFGYLTASRGDQRSRGMAGAGILALGHAGFHNSAEAKQAADSLLTYSFDQYNGHQFPKRDRYHYSLFMCCQGMYQMGSPYWEQFFPRTMRAVLTGQESDGSWHAESTRDGRFGNSYTTALVILAIGAPNQLLPIFQR